MDDVMKRWAVSELDGTKPPTNKKMEGKRGGLINRMKYGTIYDYFLCFYFTCFNLMKTW